jgi:hypothetical protein
MGRGREYTEAEILHALELRKLGLKWWQIAKRLGRGEESLCSSITRYKQGLMFSPKTAAVRARNYRMIAAAERGERVSVIAQREGVSMALVCTTLAGYGLDSEMRAAIRAALQMKEAA